MGRSSNAVSLKLAAGLLLVATLAIARTVAADPASPSLEAQTSLATARALAKTGDVLRALAEIDRTVALAPRWGEAYRLRASLKETMASSATDVDQGRSAIVFREAAADLEKVLSLGSPPDRSQLVDHIGELRASAAAAEDRQRLARQREVDQALTVQAEDIERQEREQDQQRRHEAEMVQQRRAEDTQRAAAAEAQRRHLNIFVSDPRVSIDVLYRGTQQVVRCPAAVRTSTPCSIYIPDGAGRLTLSGRALEVGDHSTRATSISLTMDVQSTSGNVSAKVKHRGYAPHIIGGILALAGLPLGIWALNEVYGRGMSGADSAVMITVGGVVGLTIFIYGLARTPYEVELEN